MVKLNLSNEKENLNMEGKAVIAIVIDPANADGVNCVSLMIGDVSPRDAAVAAGSGIGSIIEQIADNTFAKVTLAVEAMKRIKAAVNGEIEGKTLRREVKRSEEEEEIFSGKMEDFADGTF